MRTLCPHPSLAVLLPRKNDHEGLLAPEFAVSHVTVSSDAQSGASRVHQTSRFRLSRSQRGPRVRVRLFLQTFCSCSFGLIGSNSYDVSALLSTDEFKTGEGSQPTGIGGGGDSSPPQFRFASVSPLIGLFFSKGEGLQNPFLLTVLRSGWVLIWDSESLDLRHVVRLGGARKGDALLFSHVCVVSDPMGSLFVQTHRREMGAYSLSRLGMTGEDEEFGWGACSCTSHTLPGILQGLPTCIAAHPSLPLLFFGTQSGRVALCIGRNFPVPLEGAGRRERASLQPVAWISIGAAVSAASVGLQPKRQSVQGAGGAALLAVSCVCLCRERPLLACAAVSGAVCVWDFGSAAREAVGGPRKGGRKSGRRSSGFGRQQEDQRGVVAVSLPRPASPLGAPRPVTGLSFALSSSSRSVLLALSPAAAIHAAGVPLTTEEREGGGGGEPLGLAGSLRWFALGLKGGSESLGRAASQLGVSGTGPGGMSVQGGKEAFPREFSLSPSGSGILLFLSGLNVLCTRFVDSADENGEVRAVTVAEELVAEAVTGTSADWGAGGAKRFSPPRDCIHFEEILEGCKREPGSSGVFPFVSGGTLHLWQSGSGSSRSLPVEGVQGGIVPPPPPAQSGISGLEIVSRDVQCIYDFLRGDEGGDSFFLLGISVKREAVGDSTVHVSEETWVVSEKRDVIWRGDAASDAAFLTRTEGGDPEAFCLLKASAVAQGGPRPSHQGPGALGLYSPGATSVHGGGAMRRPAASQLSNGRLEVRTMRRPGQLALNKMLHAAVNSVHRVEGGRLLPSFLFFWASHPRSSLFVSSLIAGEEENLEAGGEATDGEDGLMKYLSSIAGVAGPLVSFPLIADTVVQYSPAVSLRVWNAEQRQESGNAERGGQDVVGRAGEENKAARALLAVTAEELVVVSVYPPPSRSLPGGRQCSSVFLVCSERFAESSYGCAVSAGWVLGGECVCVATRTGVMMKSVDVNTKVFPLLPLSPDGTCLSVPPRFPATPLRHLCCSPLVPMPLVSVDVDRLAVYRAFAFASSSSEAQHQQQAAGGWGPDENGSFGLLPLSSPHRHTAITSMPVSMLSALSAVSLDTHATRPKNQASGGHEKETRAKAVEDWSVATTQTILRPAQAASLGSLPPLRPPIDFGTPTRISFRSSHRGKGFLDCLLPPTQATLDALCPPPLAPPLFLSPFESLPPLFNILPLCIGPGASIQTRGEAAALFHLTEALDQTIQTSSDGHTTTPFALAALLRVQDALATLSPSGVPGRSGGRLKKGELFEAVVAAGEPALRELLTHPGLLAERANLLEKAVSHSSESVNSPMHSPTASRRQRNDARISSAAAGFVDALLRCLLQNATAPVLFPPNFSRLLYKNIPLTECISVKPRSHTWGQKTKRETGDSLGHAVGPSDIFTGLLCRQLTSIQNKPHSPSPHGNLQTPNPFRAPSSSLRVPPGLTNQSSGSLPPLIGRGAFCLLGLGIPKKHHVGRGRRPRTVADLLQESRWGAETSRRGSKETDLASGRQQGRQEMPEYCSNPVGLLFYWRWADGQSYDPKDISKCGRDGRVVTEVGGRAAQLVWPLENGTPIDCEDMWGDKAPASGSLRVGAGVSVEALSDVGEDGGLSVLGGVEAVRIQEGGKGENISAAMAREATEAGDAGREQGWTFEMWLRMPLRAGEGVSVRSPSVSSSLNLFSVGTGLSLLYHLESNKLLLQTGAGQEDRERGRGRRFSSEGRRPSFFRSFVFQRHQNGQGEDGGGGGRRDEPLIPLGRWTHIGLRVPWSGGPVEACVSTSSLELAALNREGEGERNETLLVCPELPGDSLRGSLGCAPRIGGGGMIYFEATEVRLWGVCLSAAAIASQRGRVLPCATAERGTTRLRRLRIRAHAGSQENVDTGAVPVLAPPSVIPAIAPPEAAVHAGNLGALPPPTHHRGARQSRKREVTQIPESQSPAQPDTSIPLPPDPFNQTQPNPFPDLFSTAPPPPPRPPLPPSHIPQPPFPPHTPRELDDPAVEGETPSSTSAAPLPPPSNTRSTPPFGRGLPSPVAPPSSSEPPARLPAKAGVNHTPSPMAPHSTTHKHPAERQTGTRLLPQKHSSPTGPAAAPPTVALPVHLPRALQEDEIKPRNFGEMSPITKRVFEVPLSYRPHPRTDPADPLPTSPVSRRALRAKERMRIAPPDSLARIGLTGSALYREVLGLLSEEVRRLWVEEGEAVVDAEECRRARRRRRRRELWRRFRRHTGQAEEDPFGLEFLDDGEQEREEKGEGGLAEVVEAEREGQEVEEDVSEGEEERQNQQETTQAEKALRAWIPSEGEISALISRAVESVSSTPSAALEGDSLKGTHSDFLEISRQGLGVSLGSRFWVCESSVRIGVAGLGCLTTLAGWPRPLYLPAVRESAVHTGLSEVPIPLSGDAKGRLRTAASPVKYRDRQRERERVGARWTKDDEASESAAACQTFDKMVEDGVVDYAARKADEAGVFFRSALNTVSTFVKSRSFLTADSASESVQRLQLDAQTLEALRPPPDIWMRLRAGAVLCTACRVAAVAKEFGRNGVHPVYRGLLLVVSCFLSERLRDIVTEMDQVESLKSQLTALARVGGGTSLPRALQRFRLETEAQTAAASFVGGDWDHCSRLAKEVSDEDLGLIVLKKELRQRVRFRWGTEAERDPTKTFEECRTGLLSRSVRRGIVIMAAITQSPQCRAEMHSRVLSASLASSSLTLPIPLNGVCVRQRSGGGEEMEKETQTEREKVVKATTKVTREVCGQSLSWSRSGGMHCPVCENESPISDGARRKEWGGPKARRPRLLLCWVTLRRFEADRLRRCPLCEAEIDSQAVKDHECLCPVCGVGQLPPVPRLSDGTLAVSAMSCPT